MLEALKEELSYAGDEGLNLCVLLVDAFDPRHVLGRAVVNLDIMLEHSCSVIQLETDLYADEKEEECVGTVTVDVRGHAMLLRAKMAKL